MQDIKMLDKLAPENVFRYFRMLSSVPHGSGNTKQISDLCVRFAKEHGLRCVQDEMNNIIIYKDASEGYADHAPVVLQGHLDMVCAKDDSCPKDMKTEPVTIRTDGEWLFAEGTSLGGDNIIAVAAALAILDDNTIPHPPIEAVFTTDEETGMYGAKALDISKLKGRRMLNMDSEEEGIFIAGCAGGRRARIMLKLPGETLNEGTAVSYEIVLDGLMGGHSGMEIDKGRANANKLMGRILTDLFEQFGSLRLAYAYGGEFDNAITRKAVSRVSILPEDGEKLTERIGYLNRVLKAEYSETDPDMILSACKTDETYTLLPSHEDGKKAAGMINAFPYGVIAMCKEIPDLVETSMNLGIMRFGCENGSFCMDAHFSVRSLEAAKKEAAVNMLRLVSESYGAEMTTGEDYPCWSYNEQSPIRDVCLDAFREVYGRDGSVTVIHAGLECGLFAEAIPDFDCVSFGPDLRDVHSTRERLNVASVGRFFDMVKLILKKL